MLVLPSQRPQLSHWKLHLTRYGLLLFQTFLMLVGLSAAQSDKDTPTLELGKSIERELAGGQSHSYRIVLTSGQYLHIVVDQRGIDVVVTLFGPDRKQIIEIDSPNGEQGPEPVFAIASSSGAYRLEVRSLEKEAPAGHYEVKIEELRNATQQDKSRAAAERAFMEAELLRVQETAESLQGAAKKHEDALLLFRAAGDHAREASTLGILGVIYNSLGEKRKALPYFEQALQLFRAAGDKDGEVQMLNNIGVLSSTFGENRKALQYYEQALKIQQGINDRYGEAVTRHNIGKVYWDLGDSQKALQYYEHALLLRREVKDKNGEALTLAGIGSVYWDLSEWQKALQYFDQALQLTRAQNDKVAEAAVLHNIGGVYRDLGEQREALKYFEEALSLQQTIKDRYGEAITLIAIGLAHHYLGDQPKALRYYEQALPVFRAVGDKRTEAMTLANIGSIYLDSGERQKALEYYEKALPLLIAVGDRVIEGITLNNIGTAYQYLGERQKASQYFQQSLLLSRVVKDRRGEARTLSNLMVLWDELNNPSLAVFFGKQSVKAYQALRSNIRTLDRSIQQTYLRTVVAPYRKLAELLISQNRLSEAHQILNRLRDQEFYDYSMKKDASPSSANTEPLEIGLTRREAEAERQLQTVLIRAESVYQMVDDQARETANRELTVAEQQRKQNQETDPKNESNSLQALLQELDFKFKRPAESAENIQTNDTAEMRQSLLELRQQSNQKVIAVYTLIGKDIFHALLLMPDGVTSMSVPVKGDELNSKALQFWGLLQSADYDPSLLSSDLYNVIFKPLEGKLPKDTQTIMWSLDGNLRYIPMAALYDGRHYLVERYDHVIFTRASKERLTRPVSPSWAGYGFATSAPHKVEILGDSIEFSPLDFVKDEMQIFRTKTNPGGIIEGEVFSETSFTKASLLTTLKRKRPLVHISSHFSFRPGDESRSYLVLGDGNIMTLAEIKEQGDIFQGVELLTLSACNTAAQRPDATGREIDGFAELVQRLGAGGVLASLWEVNDSSTATLMKGFYKNRQGGRYSKAEALRKAQMDLLYGGIKPAPAANILPTRSNQNNRRSPAPSGASDEDIVVEAKYRRPFKVDKRKPFAHPYYWSPFVLFGNWK